MTNFLKPSDPILTKVAEEIPQYQIDSQPIRKIVKTMLNIANGQQKDKNKPVMVGLAASQIGILKRIILVDVAADGKSLPAGRQGKVGNLKVYINPQIVWKSKQEKEWYEGCYSTGRVCGIISRPIAIKIQALTITSGFPHPMWERRLEKHTGYVARIFQHEIDHLDGKIFVMHIKDPDKLHFVEEDEFPLYRNKGAWRNWPKKCPREIWEKIRNP